MHANDVDYTKVVNIEGISTVKGNDTPQVDTRVILLDELS